MTLAVTLLWCATLGCEHDPTGIPGMPSGGADPRDVGVEVRKPGANPDSAASPDTTSVPRDSTAAPPDTISAQRDTTVAPADTVSVPRDTTAAPPDTTTYGSSVDGAVWNGRPRRAQQPGRAQPV